MNALQLNEFEEIDAIDQFPERFRIADIEQVNWAFRKIVALKAKQTEINDLAAAEIHRITHWFDTENGKLTDNIAFFEGLLTEYALNQRNADPTFKKASTPYGAVKFKKVAPKWIYDDAALVESLKANGLDELVRIKEEPNKVDMKKRLVTGSEGEVVDPETGAIIGGVRVEEVPDEVKVEVG